MRNLSGRGVAVVCGYCGQAPLSTGAAAGPRHRPPALRPCPPAFSIPVGRACGMVLSPDWISAISHAIPLSVFQVLKSDR